MPLVIVSRAQLEECLDHVRSAVSNPSEGIHGPGSVGWTLGREVINFLGGGRAALLQLAHPYVAYGVDQHSVTRDDIQGRFQRTFNAIFTIVFDDLDRAEDAARRVHAIHRNVTGEIAEDLAAFRRGHRYHANDLDALRWVHATLLDTVVQVQRLIVRPISDAEADAYLQESKLFAHLFGIPESALPRNWRGFERYVADMLASPIIDVAPPARDMGRFILQAPSQPLAPAMAWYRVMTAGLLPPRLRQPFGLSFGRAERAIFEASIAALRATYRRLPGRVRYVPSYRITLRRLAGQPPARFDLAIQRLAAWALKRRR